MPSSALHKSFDISIINNQSDQRLYSHSNTLVPNLQQDKFPGQIFKKVLLSKMFPGSAIAITAFAGAAAALPATAATTNHAAPLARTPDFGLVLHAEPPYNGLVLRSVYSDKPRLKNLIFERPSAFTPEAALINGTEQQLKSFAYLDFYGKAQEGGYYGVTLPDVGHVAGNVQDVVATLSEGLTASGAGLAAGGNAAFHVNNGTLFGKLTATSNEFFACNITVKGETRLGLKWGNPTEDNCSPTGCVPVSLSVVQLPKK